MFPLICPIPAHTIQQIHKPPIHRLRHAGGHTIKRCTRTDTRHQRHARTLYSSAQPPHYNKVYEGAGVRPVMDSCQTVQHSTDHASPAGSAPTVCGSLASSAPGAPAEGSASPPAHGQPGGVSMLLTPGGLRSGTGQQSGRTLHTAGQSSSMGAAGGRNHWRLAAASLFGLSPDS